jgi:DNA-binding XRE family transcriptional regulator
MRVVRERARDVRPIGLGELPTLQPNPCRDYRHGSHWRLRPKKSHSVRPEQLLAIVFDARVEERGGKGNGTYLSTNRAVVRAASAILGRAVKATELFDLGSDTPSGAITILRKVVPLRQRGSLKRFETTLDRILRREQILHNDFAAHVGVSRQTLLRYRAGQLEPSLVTLGRMVDTLRGMTGKP